MPTFGEYETVGEPIVTTEERGHVSTIWRAVKPAANDGREYAVKCYTPRQRNSRSAETETLSRDRGLEFLEGIKDQKKAQSTGGKSLAPIHDFGISDAGAWYVTDYFPRSNLKAWITKKGRVDSAGLRHVVGQLVAGCLALKQSRGYSHGNLKVSNAFRAGKKGTFHQTPIHLTDPYPAGPARELDPQNTELLGRAMDAEDLRAIGEIILQLVEGRLLVSSEDYNWPIAPSAAWKNLGKDGDRWLTLCNQLLDGNRAPDAVTLESLAQEFRPRADKSKMLLITAAAVVVVSVLGVGIIALKNASTKRSRAKFNADLQAAQQAHSLTNLNEALTRINSALEREPTSTEAANLKREIEAAFEREFAAAIQSADAKLTAFTAESVSAAEQFLKTAETLKPQDPRANELRGRITKARQDLQAETQRKQLLDALATYLKQGDAEAQAGAPNWLQASNYYALAATNAARLGDSANRQLAERGLARAVTAIEAQTGEERLRNQIQSLQSQAREAARTNNWLLAVNLYDQTKTKAAGLTNNPISVEAELKNAQAKLAEWQQNEAARKTINDLLAQGRAQFQSANWPAATNSFYRAFTNATRIADTQLQETARTNLQAAIQRLEEQERQRLATQRQQAEELAHQQASAALDAGSFAQARQQASQHSGQRFAQLLQRINQQESLWQTMSNQLVQAQYESILSATNLPGSKPFTDLKTTAASEKRILDDASREYAQGTATGNFAFLRLNAFTALSSKPGFTNLVQMAREELTLGQAATELLNKPDLPAARKYLFSNTVQSKTNKEPFRTLIAQLVTRENALQQDEAAFGKLVAEGDKLFQEGKFAEAQVKANEALSRFPNVSSRSRADDLVKRAGAQITRTTDLQRARSALKSGDYSTVASVSAAYANDGEFTALAGTASTESAALRDYRSSFDQGNYGFVPELEGKSDYAGKQPFADLLREAKVESGILTELQGMQTATNWSGLLGRFSSIAQPTAGKPPFVKFKAWADGLKKSEEDRQVAQLQSLDTELEKMLVWFNVVRAGVTQTAQQASRLGALGNAKAAYSNRANWLESQYPANWLDQPNWLQNKSRRALLAELKRSISNWE